MEYGKDYFGFVYVWYNRCALEMERQDYQKAGRHHRKKKKHPRLYIGAHYGPYDDGYVCSSKWMKDSYKRHPENFIRRILYYQQTPNRKELYETEQKWLDLIDDNELGTRFYNFRKHGVGPITFDRDRKSAAGKRNWQNPEYRKRGLRYLKKYDEKRRRNLSVVMKKRWSNPDYLKIQREYKHTPEAIAKITATSKGRKFSEHTRQKMRDNAKKRPSSYYTKAVAASHTPEATAKRVSKLRGQKRTLEQRERMRQARLNYLKWTKENGEDSSKDSA